MDKGVNATRDVNGPEVSCDSSHEFHSHLYKTMDLLRLYQKSGEPVYFIVQGLASIKPEDAEWRQPLDNSYTYDEHSCPTNYIPVEAVYTTYEDDPHGVFEYVRSAWYPAAMDETGADTDAIMRGLFPETMETEVTIDGEVSGPILTLPSDAGG